MKPCYLRILLVGLSLGLFPCEVRAQIDPASVPTALREYVDLPDASFAWKLNEKTEGTLGRVYDIDLTSQTWMDMPWKHVFMIYEPKVIAHPEHVMLFITG